jgi:hypothetical protein
MRKLLQVSDPACIVPVEGTLWHERSGQSMSYASASLHDHLHSSYDPCMPRTPSSDRFEVKGLTAAADERAGWVAISTSRAIPTRFTIRANLSRPDCDVALLAVVGSDGEVMVKSAQINVPVPGSASLTTSTMRSILIHHLVQLAIEKVARPVNFMPEVHRGAFQVEGQSEEGVWVGPVPHEGRGRRTPRDQINVASGLYREAVARGSRAPVKDVAAILGISASQVSRYLKSARADGLLADVPAPSPGPRRLMPASIDIEGVATIGSDGEPSPGQGSTYNMEAPFPSDGMAIGPAEHVLSEEALELRRRSISDALAGTSAPAQNDPAKEGSNANESDQD